MEKLVEAMQKDLELAKIVFGEDKEAAYEAANAVVPCDKAKFEAFYNEQRAKSAAMVKVFQRAATDEEFAKIIYGEDRKAAYEAAQEVASGYTAEEFENVCKMLVAAALKVYNKDDELLSDEELDQVAGGGLLFGAVKLVTGIGLTGVAIAAGIAGSPAASMVISIPAARLTRYGGGEVVKEIKNANSGGDILVSIAKDVVTARNALGI